jgi:hypothetical protein
MILALTDMLVDSIKVLLDSNGVSFYMRSWSEIEAEISNTKEKLISPEKARIAGQVYLKKSLKGDTSTLVADEAELVYFSKPFFTTKNELLPTYKVSMGGHSAYIYADTGDVIDGQMLVDDTLK